MSNILDNKTSIEALGYEINYDDPDEQENIEQ